MFFDDISKMRKKPFYISTTLLLSALLLIINGCERAKPPAEISPKTLKSDNNLSIYIRFAPEKIDIMPLTEFVDAENAQQSRINIYVSLIDKFGSQIKSPGVFRFELYEYMQRSAQPKGKRAFIWPDVDLTDSAANNDSWRDFLRAYEFSFPCKQTNSNDYILQVTCLCPNGKRLSSEYTLRHTK